MTVVVGVTSSSLEGARHFRVMHFQMNEGPTVGVKTGGSRVGGPELCV